MTAHDHSWAQDTDEARALCPDLNPQLIPLGIRCPGDTGTCACGEEATASCVLCDAPLCGDCGTAARGDRACQACAPRP